MAFAARSDTDVLTVSDVAARLDVHPQTIRRWERLGEFPPPRRFGPRLVGWLPMDVSSWLMTRTPRVRK